MALGILGGLVVLVAGLALRGDYRGVGADYEGYMQSRGRAGSTATRTGLIYMFAGAVFASSGLIGVWIY